MAEGTHLLQLMAAMARQPPAEPLQRLCQALQHTLSVDDVVLSIASPTWPVVAAATGEQARALEERQLLVGDGPTVEAWLSARPVESRSPRPPRRPSAQNHGAGDAAQLSSQDTTGHEEEAEVGRRNRERWPLLMAVLGRPVPYAGHVAVPLAAPHGPPVGVVSCFLRRHDTRATPEASTTSTTGTVSTATAAHALSELAETVTQVLSLVAAVEPEHPGASMTANPPRPATGTAELARDREARLHVAAGMVAVQIGDSPEAALARIRAHAYVTDATIHAVARDVITRRLRLQP